MSKSRNNLLGVGGQRKKLPRSQGQSTGPSARDRSSAAEQKQELLRRMRERAEQRPGESTAPADSPQSGPDRADSASDAPTADASTSDDSGRRENQ